MKDTPRVCVDRVPTPEQVMEGARLAMEENPSNAPAPPRFSPGMGVAPEASPFALAALTGVKWRNGRTLKVSFMGGEPGMHETVAHFARLWEPHANIRLDFGDHNDAQIRVAFELNGRSWSWLGTQALTISKDEPTMNYGWLTPDTGETEYERVVCHEFGHALGCIHEHQHPEAGIPWNKEAVYAYYAGPPNHWPTDTVDHNLFRRYSRTQTQFSAFDTKSIMLYAIRNEFTVGDFEVGWNRQLSDKDKSFMGVMYPKEERGAVGLEVGEPALKADIGEHGEEDIYRFEISEAGLYSVATGGKTDVVMSLFGPDDESLLLDQDDDSGLGLNARIIQRLDPGTYFVRVRHYRPRGTGQYEISLNSVKRIKRPGR